MTHISQLLLSMHADGALPEDQALVVNAHLGACAHCQASLAAMRTESRFLKSAMVAGAVGEAADLVVPEFSRPISFRGFAMANLMMGLVIWLIQFLWKTLFGELVMNATEWVASIYLPDAYAITSTLFLTLIEKGTTMFNTYLGYVVLCLIATTFLWLVLYRRVHTLMCVCLLVVVSGGMLLPEPANALEVRRDKEIVTIASTETIDDTLIVVAETIRIEGNILGDVVAVGRRIDVTGSVTGNLITFAESVKVRGQVGGLVLAGAESYELVDATVGGDAWLSGEKITIDETSRVSGNAVVATRHVSVDGAVDKDLYAFAETVELGGDLGRHLDTHANRVRLLGDAHVGGDVRFRSGSEERLQKSEAARIDGEVRFLDMPEGFEVDSPYASIGFYLWQVARLIAGLLVGVIFLWLVPGFRGVSIRSGVAGLKTAGIGIAAMIGVPIIAVVVAVSVVGIPVALAALAFWLLALYLAKIAVGAVLGRMLMADSEGNLLPLLAGLAIVIAVTNVPFIGGPISFVLTVFGLGLLTEYMYRNFTGPTVATP